MELEQFGIKVNKNNVAVVSSRKIAEYFGKRHDDVLKAIRNLTCSPEFNVRNFAEVNYKDKKGESRPEFLMTRDGFVFLVMGFTGEKASEIKEQYIEAFNHMEQWIKDRKDLRLECRVLTDNLKFTREMMGKETKSFHYSNEFNLINRIVLGMDAKHYREKHGLKDEESIRGYIPEPLIAIIQKMQNFDTSLIIMELSYEERKLQLNEFYQKLIRLNESRLAIAV